MPETLTPLIELRNLRWAIQSLAQMNSEPGSCEKENRANAARGIESRINWVIRTLEACGEGKTNAGA
jgi:hypothetical protein